MTQRTTLRMPRQPAATSKKPVRALSAQQRVTWQALGERFNRAVQQNNFRLSLH
jgi:hypothetical protein